MRASLAVLLLISLLPAAYPGSTGCATCDELANAPQTGIFVLMNSSDASNQHIDIVAYYDNITASPSRQNLSNSILLIEVANTSGLYVVQKTYTNAQGKATFKFNQWNNSCITFKVMYCPYCVPTDIDCEGFKQCLNFSKIQTTANNSDQILPADDAGSVPSPLNPGKYLPQIATASYCPPPQPLSATPAICLPLIIIFSLLSGALYLTGRNPFAGFNIGGQRIGQHIRYQARGRGFQFSVTQALIGLSSAVEAGVYAGGKDTKTGKTRGISGLAKREAMRAEQRGLFMVTGSTGLFGKYGLVNRVTQGWAATRQGMQARSSDRTVAGGQALRSGGGSGTQITPMTPGTMQQQQISGSSGAFGGQIFQGGFLGSLARITAFIVLSTPLFRAADAVWSSATYDDTTGRSSSIYQFIFSIRDPTVTDIAATMTQFRGERGGTRVYLDSEHRQEAEVLREERVHADGTPIQPGEKPRDSDLRIFTVATYGAAGMTGDQYTVTVNSDNRVQAVSFNIAGVGPVEMRKTSAGDLNVFVSSVGPNGEVRREAVAPGSSQMQAIMDAYRNVPIQFSLGGSTSDFVGNVDATRTTMAMLAQQMAQAAQADQFGTRNRTMEGLRGSPEATDAYDSLREREAKESVALALGRSPGGEVAGDALSGIPTTGESQVGQLGVYEVAASRTHSADQTAGVDTVSFLWGGGGHMGFTELMTTSRGASVLAERAGLSDADRTLAERALPGALGSRNLGELTSMTPAQLRETIPGLSAAGARELASQVHDFAGNFSSALQSQGFNQTFINGLGDVSRVSALSVTGANMDDSRIPDVIASHPDFIARLPPAVSEPAREHGYLTVQANTAASIGNPDHPPHLNSDTTSTIERIYDMDMSSHMATARYGLQSVGSELPEDPHGTRLDAGLQYYRMDSVALDPYDRSRDLSADSIARRESDRMDALSGYLDSRGPTDVGTARSMVAEEYERSRMLESAARTAGDADYAERFSRRADGCLNALGRIDEIASSRRGSDRRAREVVDAITSPAPTVDYANAVVRTRDSLHSIYHGDTPPPGPPRPQMGDFPTRDEAHPRRPGERGGSDSDTRTA